MTNEERIASGMMPYLHDYAAAAAHEAAVTPLRKSDPPIKPLGPRKKGRNYNIYREENGSISIFAWGNRRITYHPNGDIELLVWPHSAHDQTGLEELRQVLGTSLFVHDHGQWVGCKVEGFTRYPDGSGYLPINKEKDAPREAGARRGRSHIVLRREEQGRALRATDFAYPVVHQIDRVGMREARKHYAPFRNYAERVIKLQGTGSIGTQEEFAEYWGTRESHYARHLREAIYPPIIQNSHVTATELLAMSQDVRPEMRHKAYLWVLRQHHPYSPQTFLTLTASQHIEAFNNSLDHLIQLGHREVVFKERTIQTGATVVDRYRKFFS